MVDVSFVISGLAQQAGGTTAAVVALGRALAAENCRIRLFAVAEPQEALRPRQPVDGLQLITAPPSPPRRLAASAALRRLMHSQGGNGVWHGHGLWELPVHYSATLSRKLNAPFMLCVHGMLEPWALNRSRLKKRLIGALYQDRDLRGASCLHAITPAEVMSFRSYGLTNPIAVVPNGVDLSDFDGLGQQRGQFAALFPQSAGRPLALFLSRIHPKKGLIHLLRAWRSVGRDHPDWLLAVAGPDCNGHRAEIERLAGHLEIGRSLLFTGPLYGEEKLAVLANAEFFALPSFSEGFSVAVLEAMACRLPVLITPGCNFPEVEERGAGVIVEPTKEGTEQGLRQLMELSAASRRSMGDCGQQLIKENHTWSMLAKRMIEVYEWLLGERERPECVES